nr:hypothetical protein [Tanacetum cinerariifolium]
MLFDQPRPPEEGESLTVYKSSVKNLLAIPREYEVTSEDKRECDVLVCEDFSTFDVCKDHSEILSNSNNDDISSDDDAFKDIEYVEASPLDSELVSLEEENDVYQEEKDDHTEETRSGNTTTHANKSLPEYDLFCFEIEPGQERLTSVVISDDSTNDPLLEEVNLFLASDNLIPWGIRNIDYDSERDIHFLKELLVDDSIPIPENESSNFDHQDDSSFLRPPPEQPDVEFFFDLKPNSGELILTVMNNIDELNEDECFDPRGFNPTMIEVSRVRYVVPVHMVFTSFVCMDCAKITKKQSKPDRIEHEITKIAQKPDQRTFSVQVIKSKALQK